MARHSANDLPSEDAPDNVSGPTGFFLSPLALSQDEIEAARGFHCVDAGNYEMEITKAVLALSKNSHLPHLIITARPLVEDDPLISSVRDYVGITTAGLDRATRERKDLQIKEFTRSCNLNMGELLELISLNYPNLNEENAFTGIEIEDLVGVTGTAKLNYEPEGTYIKDDGSEGKSFEKNTVSKWLI